MSAPRQILPGTTYLLTRRCIGRQFLLLPSAFTNQVFLYCLAVAAAKHGILLHAVCVMANHYHLVATDPDANLPEFMRYLNEFVAKTMNAHWGRWESFFAPGSYSAVTLTDAESVLEKMTYTLTNPVDALLVDASRKWPGLVFQAEDIGQSFTVRRPDTLFRKNGPLPETATLTLSPPPVGMRPSQGADSVAQFIAELTQRVAEKETGLCQTARREGKRFLGRRQVLRQKHTDTPKTREPRRTLNPRIAGRDTGRRIEALKQLKAFLAAYRAAWLSFKDGVRDVVFPEGTYALRLLQNVCCGPGG